MGYFKQSNQLFQMQRQFLLSDWIIIKIYQIFWNRFGLMLLLTSAIQIIYWSFSLQFGSTLVLWAPSFSSWSSSSFWLTLPTPGTKCGWGMPRRAIQSVGSQVRWGQLDILFTTIAFKGGVTQSTQFKGRITRLLPFAHRSVVLHYPTLRPGVYGYRAVLCVLHETRQLRRTQVLHQLQPYSLLHRFCGFYSAQSAGKSG